MRAQLLTRRRIVLAEGAFAEVVVWLLPDPLPGSSHPFNYRMAYVVGDRCVVRLDNERGKGDHLHVGGRESPYVFTTPDRLMHDFQAEIARWNHAHRRS
jgi:hypothetical protein